MRFLSYFGYIWCGAMVFGYFAIWLTSEHGGGIFSKSGFGEIWLIVLACLPGVALIKFAEQRNQTRQKE
jgi:hypothetical protein